MKVAVINFSGNVGKSTVARHLLSPRMNNAQVIAVESINADGTEDEAIRGKHFAELLESIALLKDVVIDVGASNVEDFISMMTKYSGSHEDFDYYVVPTVAKAKQQADTIATINALSDIGITPEKIRLVFNMVEDDETPRHLFSGIFKYHDDKEAFNLIPDAVLHVNDIYGKLKETGRSVTDVLKDKTDLKEKLQNAKTDEEIVSLTRQISVKRLATGVTEELDKVFKLLFG
ncbi:hypothetical protein MCAMS1_02826 [biofilm metagenome]